MRGLITVRLLRPPLMCTFKIKGHVHKSISSSSPVLHWMTPPPNLLQHVSFITAVLLQLLFGAFLRRLRLGSRGQTAQTNQIAELARNIGRVFFFFFSSLSVSSDKSRGAAPDEPGWSDVTAASRRLLLSQTDEFPAGLLKKRGGGRGLSAKWLFYQPLSAEDVRRAAESPLSRSGEREKHSKGTSSGLPQCFPSQPSPRADRRTSLRAPLAAALFRRRRLPETSSQTASEQSRSKAVPQGQGPGVIKGCGAITHCRFTNLTRH